jgi:small subunit ribosomal protein S5
MSDKKNDSNQDLKEEEAVAEVLATEVASASPEARENEVPRVPHASGRGQGARRRQGGSNARAGNQRGDKKRGRRDEKPEKEFEEELLQVDRVTRVVKGGRRLRFRATVAIGDRRGRVGFGVDKAIEVPQAIQKAVRNARKNMIEVPIVNGTIAHEVKVKYKSAKILIMPAKNGTGIIAGGAMRKIADLAGIEDMLGKNLGTNNRITSGKAMMQALASLKGAKLRIETADDLAAQQQPAVAAPELTETADS